MTVGEVSPSETLQQMILGFQVSQGLYVAATLGIADLLAGGPRNAKELAETTETDAPTLYRVLRGKPRHGPLYACLHC